jgi:hypothetical protein
VPQHAGLVLPGEVLTRRAVTVVTAAIVVRMRPLGFSADISLLYLTVILGSPMRSS